MRALTNKAPKMKMLKSLSIVMIILSTLSPSFASNATSYQLKSVEFTDNKALGRTNTFVVKYTFLDEEIGVIKIICDDDQAQSFLTTSKLLPGKELVSNDFYCFEFEQLVIDLENVTNKYSMPSFSGSNRKSHIVFNFSSTIVNIPLEIDLEKNEINIFSRDAGQLLKTYQ